MDWGILGDWIVNQGIWCALFVFMLLKTQKENDEREERYLNTINTTISRNTKTIHELITTLKGGETE